MDTASYRDHRDFDPERGCALEVKQVYREVTLTLGVMRNFGSISPDGWAALTPHEARELANDLWTAAAQAEKGQNP